MAGQSISINDETSSMSCARFSNLEIACLASFANIFIGWCGSWVGSREHIFYAAVCALHYPIMFQPKVMPNDNQGSCQLIPRPEMTR